MSTLDPVTLTLLALGFTAILLGSGPARFPRRLREILTGRRSSTIVYTIRGPAGYGVHLDKFRVSTVKGTFIAVDSGTRIIPESGELKIEMTPDIEICAVRSNNGQPLRISGS